MYAIIMSGGRGKRFWPKSQNNYPKQFLKLYSDKTLIQYTYYRIRKLLKPEDIYTVTRRDYVHLIKNQIPEFPEKNIIVEPEPKNTAPCIGFGIVHTGRKEDETVIILPSDHYIKQEDDFVELLQKAEEISQLNDSLITIGLEPKYPHTGYGYIKVSKLFLNDAKFPVYYVDKFVEKPDLETAKRFLKDGNYYWNSGIFIWRAKILLEGLQKFLPQIYQGLNYYKNSNKSEEIAQKIYKNFPEISIDYGLLQKADNILMLSADIEWSDLGSWTAIEKLSSKDSNNNVILDENIFTLDSSNNIVTSNLKTVLIGVENLIVVQNGEYLLICRKDMEGKIREMVDLVEDWERKKERSEKQ